MPTITAAIITWNEERNIQRCIESLKDCVDHIIVLDSFSTDATIEICNKLNVQVIQRKWEGYAASKNYLNAQVQTDLILSLDADEALSSELSEEIEIRTLDSFQLDCISFIKLDVEENELQVLMGGIETIKRSYPVIMFEMNHVRPDLVLFLEELQYTVNNIRGYVNMFLATR